MRRSAFTLIELTLYITLAVVVLFGSSTMMSLIFEARTKDMVVNEVEQQGDAVLQIITQSIRNAIAVNSPTPETSADTLVLDTLVGANNPTIFNLVSGTIFMKEGAAESVALTNSQVAAATLNFQNLAPIGTNDDLRVSFTVTYNSSSTRQVYQYGRNFYGSGALRQ